MREFKIGDKVKYLQHPRGKNGPIFTIEEVLVRGVYRIGNRTSFVDMVPANLLQKIPPHAVRRN